MYCLDSIQEMCRGNKYKYMHSIYKCDLGVSEKQKIYKKKKKQEERIIYGGNALLIV